VSNGAQLRLVVTFLRMTGYCGFEARSAEKPCLFAVRGISPCGRNDVARAFVDAAREFPGLPTRMAPQSLCRRTEGASRRHQDPELWRTPLSPFVCHCFVWETSGLCNRPVSWIVRLGPARVDAAPGPCRSASRSCPLVEGTSRL